MILLCDECILLLFPSSIHHYNTMSPPPHIRQLGPCNQGKYAFSYLYFLTMALAPCQYKTGKTLGQGSYAIVKEAVHVKTGDKYVTVSH